MILGHGQNALTLDEARFKLCAQARLFGRDCNPAFLSKTLHQQGLTFGDGFAQSKDAIIYVTIIVVFYITIVLILIGTNIKLGRKIQTANNRKHVVEFTEGIGTHSRLVPSNDDVIALQPNIKKSILQDEAFAEV